MSDRTSTASGTNRTPDYQTPHTAQEQPSASTQDQASRAASHAADQAKDAASKAHAEGASLAGDAKQRVSEQATAGKDGVADRLEEVAKAVHRSGEQLEGQQDWVAHMIERGADELSSLAHTLRNNDLRSLVGSVEDLGRRQPALFLGASIAAGFALVRFGRVAVEDSSRSDLPHAPEAFRERT
ncbi:MAG: hypothetical protein AB7F35_09880 [Acetobacteraceae bacterium]